MYLGQRICSVEFVVITGLVIISNVGIKRADCISLNFKKTEKNALPLNIRNTLRTTACKTLDSKFFSYTNDCEITDCVLGNPHTLQFCMSRDA